jgi:hypothetical protein
MRKNRRIVLMERNSSLSCLWNNSRRKVCSTGEPVLGGDSHLLKPIGKPLLRKKANGRGFFERAKKKGERGKLVKRVIFAKFHKNPFTPYYCYEKGGRESEYPTPASSLLSLRDSFPRIGKPFVVPTPSCLIQLTGVKQIDIVCLSSENNLPCALAEKPTQLMSASQF